MSLISREPTDFLNQSYAHPNPMFDYLTGFQPRKLKDLFRWTEYLYYNSPQIFTALQKLSDYMITEITYQSEGAATRSKYEDLVSRRMRFATTLKTAAQDRSIYGNSFISLYLPFKRVLKCSKCRALWDITALPKFDYAWQKLTFSFDCPMCQRRSVTHLRDVRDFKINKPERINVIRWDPKLIDIDGDPVTGESIYYYTLPQHVKEKIHRGENHVIARMPKPFLESVRKKKLFKFERDQIFHMKVDAPAGVDTRWGFPVLTSSLQQFFYVQALRRANEAIALDHITPFRVLHPAQTSAAADPVEKLNFRQWQHELKSNLKQWRRDPLHIMMAPLALGVTQMGGQGRTLLTLGEVKEAEDNILAGMGVPPEFVHGGLSFTGSSVTLRMLENQLLSQTADLLDLLQWVCDKVGDYMGWERVQADIVNFKFIDDFQQKSALMQANAQYDFLSKKTIAEQFSINIDEENDQRKQEILDNVRWESEVQKEIDQLQSSLAEQAHQEAAGAPGMNYDQQMMIAQADALVDQLMQMDEGMRRSQMSSLQAEDYVMYSVVTQRLEEAELQMTNMAEQQIQAG